MSGTDMLNAELALLSGLSKKRNEPLKLACSKSLAILAQLEAEYPSSEAPDSGATNTIASALANEPDFVEPFLLACSLASAKSCASALQCLQWMLSTKAMAPSQLSKLLEALFEAAQLGSAIQLKILQLLPLILQNYDEHIRGQLVVELLHVAAELHGENKVAMVHNAAYATLQQLIDGLFERVSRELKNNRSEPKETFDLVANTASREAASQAYEVTKDELDAARVLVDLCLIAEKNDPVFTKMPKSISVTFTLELLELTLTNHADLFGKVPLFGAILREKITPLLIQLFSESAEFAPTLRTVRTLYLLLRRHLKIIHLEAEVILSQLGSAITQSPRWKSVLCLEVFQGLFMEFKIVLELFSYPSIRSLITSVITSFADSIANGEFTLPLAVVRASQSLLASEHDNSDAASISSSMPNSPALSAQGTGKTVVLSRASQAKVPFIDLLDKQEPPRVSKNYVIFLVLMSINSLSEGLSKFAQADKKTSQMAAGVLVELEDPIIRCYTAFLGGSMELELYKTVVKSVQRFSHAAGILDLEKTRDDYMNLLDQFGIPPEDPQIRKLLISRHVLCIRALFNLCFALGNKLKTSWSIFADCLGKLQAISTPDASSEISRQAMFGGVDYMRPAAASLNRLLETTVDLDDEAIVYIFETLGSMGSRMMPIHLYAIEAVAFNNADRLSVAHSSCWKALLSVLGGIIKSNDSHSLLAAQVLNEANCTAIASCSSPEGFVDLLQGVKVQMEADLQHGEITLGAMHALERILDQFGDKLTAGWDVIFSIISLLFEMDARKELPAKWRPGLIKSSFHSLELICTDFLYHCPDNCLHRVISCLDQFARLKDDEINISFTAISLFWLVCDHLTRDISPSTEFPPVSDKQVLADLAAAHGSSERVSLWLTALLRLASIANEPQHQLKIGAIQIIFRLFQSHDKLLPKSAWNTCLTLVFPSLMTIEPDEDDTDATETHSLVLGGLSQLYKSHLSTMVQMPGFETAWQQLFDYFTKIVDTCAQDSINVYRAFDVVLKAASENNISAAQSTIWQFWINRNPSPVLDDKRPRKTVEAIQLLVSLYDGISSFICPDIEQQKDAVLLISKAAKYDYTGEAFSPSSPSTTQLICLEQLSNFDAKDNGLQALIISVFADLSLLPYDFASTESAAAVAVGAAFLGMSKWSQSTLLSKLSDLAYEYDRLAEFMTVVEAPEAIKKTLKVCLKIMSEPGREDAVALYLLILGWSGQYDLGDMVSSVVSGLELILESGPTTDDSDWQMEIGALDTFVGILLNYPETFNTPENWGPCVKLIANNSLLYERGLITLTSFMGEFPLCLDGPEFFGTIAPPAPFSRQPLRYHCLKILQSLAFSDICCAQTALDYYIKRAKLVLHQYVGDLRVRGTEPMPFLLHRELQTILTQLAGSSVIAKMAPLITRCIASPDSDIRSQIQDILLN